MLAYQEKLQTLRSILDRAGSDAGVIWRTPTEHDLSVLDENMRAYLGCSLPACYADVLRHCGGITTQTSMLSGVDVVEGSKSDDWPMKGVIYGSLCSLRNPKQSEWIVVGEKDDEIFGISRDGERFATIHGDGKDDVDREFDSLDSMLCYFIDKMILSNSHR